MNRTTEQVDNLVREGWCMGSEFLPRAFDRENNEGMCVHCTKYVPLNDSLTIRHKQ